MLRKIITFIILLSIASAFCLFPAKASFEQVQELESPNYIDFELGEQAPEYAPINDPLLSINVAEIKRNTYIEDYNLGGCNLSTYNNKLPNFGEDVVFNYEWFENDDFVYYGLYTPSTAINSNQDFPLIVWLHGGNEFFCTKEYFQNSGILKVLNNYKLNNFNSYVLCPQMIGPHYNYGLWCSDNSAEQLKRLVDDIIENYNIDKDRIYLMGFSQGGRGLFHVANYMSEYYAACVAMSPFDPSVDPGEIKIPIRAYTEFDNYSARRIAELWGKENVIKLYCIHGAVPNTSMTIDKDNNNCADMLEWLLNQSK